MQTDYNQLGSQYVSYSKPSKEEHLNDWNQKAKFTFDTIKQHLKKTNLVNFHPLISRVNGILLYSYYIRKDLDKIITEEVLPSKEFLAKSEDAMAVFGTLSTTINYESFLFQCRSSLDIFFNFIYKNFGEPTNSMKKSFPNNLNRYHEYCRQKSSETVFSDLFKQIDMIKTDIHPTLVKLRNKITHENSAWTLSNNQFALFASCDGNVLLIDCDINGTALIESVMELSKLIPYYLIKSLSIVSGLDSGTVPDDFSLLWKNKFVNYTKFLDDNGESLQVVRFDDDGFSLNQVKVNLEKMMEYSF